MRSRARSRGSRRATWACTGETPTRPRASTASSTRASSSRARRRSICWSSARAARAPPTHERAREARDAYLGGIDQALAPERRFLVGDELTLADIVFATELALFSAERAHREKLEEAGLAALWTMRSLREDFPRALGALRTPVRARGVRPGARALPGEARWPTRVTDLASRSSSARATTSAPRSRSGSPRAATRSAVGRRHADKLASLVARDRGERRQRARVRARRARRGERAAGVRDDRARARPARGGRVQRRRQRELPDHRDHEPRVPQGVGDGVPRRLPDRPRGGARDAAAPPRLDLLHGRDREPARRQGLCGVRIGEVRSARARAEHGARARAGEHPRRASRDRRGRGHGVGARADPGLGPRSRSAAARHADESRLRSARPTGCSTSSRATRGRSSSICARIARAGEAMAQGALVLGVGAAEGLGGALCRRFAREGLEVFAAGAPRRSSTRSPTEIRATAAARTRSPRT